MHITTKRTWPLHCGRLDEGDNTRDVLRLYEILGAAVDVDFRNWLQPKVMLSPGRYEVERVPCQRHHVTWLVIKGTMLGCAESFWRQWVKGSRNAAGEVVDWGDFEVEIEE